jgi:hypothetical protein
MQGNGSGGISVKTASACDNTFGFALAGAIEIGLHLEKDRLEKDFCIIQWRDRHSHNLGH